MPSSEQKEYKAPSHCCNLLPPWEMWAIRAWPTNTQKNSRNSNNSKWKSSVKFIKPIREKSISVWRRRRYIACLVYKESFGTFGYSVFVSFGISSLNSITKGPCDVLDMGTFFSQIKYTTASKEVFQC